MAISASDIKLRYSVTTGSAGDSSAGTAAGSLGKYISTTDFSTAANGLFDNISGAENAAQVSEYRCLFILNNHATLTYNNVTVYIASDTAGGAAIDIALDNIAVSAKGSSSAQAALIASETTTPSGVGAFSAPTTAGTGLLIGNMAPGQVKAVWVRRTPGSGPAVTDGFSLGVSGDTPP